MGDLASLAGIRMQIDQQHPARVVYELDLPTAS